MTDDLLRKRVHDLELWRAEMMAEFRHFTEDIGEIKVLLADQAKERERQRASTRLTLIASGLAFFSSLIMLGISLVLRSTGAS